VPLNLNPHLIDVQLLHLVAAAAAGSLATLAFHSPAETVLQTEPPLRVEVTVDDQVHLLTDGERKSIEHKKRTFDIGVRVADTRVFDAAGVRFEFPRAFRWAYDGEDFDTYDVDGDDALLQIQVHEGLAMAEEDPSAAGVMAEMLEALEARRPEVEETTIDLGGVSYPATRVSANFMGTTMDALATCIAVGETTVVVIVQEYEDASGRAWTDETERLLEMLASTFVIASGS
jgi:hypothetical protein